MDRDAVGRWVGEYERAWREEDVSAVEVLFSEDAEYRVSPYTVGGRPRGDQGAVARRRRPAVDDGARVVAVDDDTAVVRVDVVYEAGSRVTATSGSSGSLPTAASPTTRSGPTGRTGPTWPPAPPRRDVPGLNRRPTG